MTELFGRSIEATVDTIKLTGHRIKFRATKTLKKEPNTCEIMFWNMTDEQRSQLSKKKEPELRLAAGYGTDLTQLFVGTAIYVKHEVKGGDIITTVSTTDGGEKYAKARINLSFGPKTKIDTVLKNIVKQMGIKPGNLNKVAAELSRGLKADIYIEGAVISGSCATELTHLCRSAGYEWSIQDGALQILNLNQALDQFAIKLGPDSGLLMSSIDNKGILTAQCLLVKDIFPGRQVEINGKFTKGRFRIESVIYTGDTEADEWFCDFEAKSKI
jgi:hypothetical protein